MTIKKHSLSLFITLWVFFGISCNEPVSTPIVETVADTTKIEEEQQPKSIDPASIKIEKELLYDKYTLEDTYPYKDTTRQYQWDKIKQGLAFVDSIHNEPSSWAVLQNYKNLNGEAPLVRNYKRNAYTRIADSLGVERYQSVPLYYVNDSIKPECYGRDGWLVKYIEKEGTFDKIATVDIHGEWIVPQRYIKQLSDTTIFNKVIFIDTSNQNIATLEKSDSGWLVRSMNPATTGRHQPPHMQETPTGIFVIQEKKFKMHYLVDGSSEIGGFAPYASRFTNGAYIHGIPVNAPSTQTIEFSASLGTTPRSHMCVRNATSHAKFVYDWAPTLSTLVFVID